MKAIEAYQTYLAVKQHFSDNSYDYFKYNGRIRLNESIFHTRKDRFFYEKLARKFSDKPDDELRNYFVSNLSQNPKVWIRELVGIRAEETYTKWKAYQESLTYNLLQDVAKIDESHEGDFSSLFLCRDGQHPALLNLYTNSEIAIETLIGCDILMECFDRWNKEIDDTIIWPNIYLFCQRYRPFLNIEEAATDGKFRQALKQVFIPRMGEK